MQIRQIQMLETCKGTDDGFLVRSFPRGAIYIIGKTIGDTLARKFIADNVAIDFDTLHYTIKNRIWMCNEVNEEMAANYAWIAITQFIKHLNFERAL